MSSKMFKKTLMSLIFLTSTFITSTTFAEMGKNGRIKEGTTSNLREYRYSFDRYYLQDAKRDSKYTIKASIKPYQFDKKLKKNEFVSKQLINTGLISYLLYENGVITIDLKSPANRLGDMFDDNTQLNSQSVGKSIVSYILGHAICEGFIPSIEHEINDWPLLENTLYHNQRVIDLINMKAGDGKYFKRSKINNGKNLNNYLAEDIINLHLRGSKPGRKIFNYNGFLPNLINNYIYFKVGEKNHIEFLEKIFHEKIKIKNDVFFLYKPYISKSFRSTFFASRYDYLRIARAMLIDWQNDTCVGKYLKNILKQKANRQTRKKSPFSSAAGYAGFFHTDFKYGFGKVSGNIFGMNGYGGQNIFINFDTGKIVSAHAVHQDYDWKKLIFKAVDKK